MALTCDPVPLKYRMQIIVNRLADVQLKNVMHGT